MYARSKLAPAVTQTPLLLIRCRFQGEGDYQVVNVSAKITASSSEAEKRDVVGLQEQALKEAFEIFCNMGVAGSSSAELLATFCDILKKGGSEKLIDEAIEDTLEKAFLLLWMPSFHTSEGERNALTLGGTLLGDYSVRILPSKTAIAPQVTERFDVCVEDETVNYLNRLDALKALVRVWLGSDNGMFVANEALEQAGSVLSDWEAIPPFWDGLGRDEKADVALTWLWDRIPNWEAYPPL
ncbi:hypothetical protein L1987_04017 [Smallanthus sonchifolius]|uniref:Uncharacterized protein n=1 Tax=Smallanthus sonchifolius TaxID=185202 RepID=A0ACB9KCA9_9ASTR|nr:hypothetical protein L1987_04017 [Smallanthus sonchifolius]